LFNINFKQNIITTQNTTLKSIEFKNSNQIYFMFKKGILSLFMGCGVVEQTLLIRQKKHSFKALN